MWRATRVSVGTHSFCPLNEYPSSMESPPQVRVSSLPYPAGLAKVVSLWRGTGAPRLYNTDDRRGLDVGRSLVDRADS